MNQLYRRYLASIDLKHDQNVLDICTLEVRKLFQDFMSPFKMKCSNKSEIYPKLLSVQRLILESFIQTWVLRGIYKLIF